MATRAKEAHGPVKCPQCEKVFKNRSGLSSHLRGIHGVKINTPRAVRDRRNKVKVGRPGHPPRTKNKTRSARKKHVLGSGDIKALLRVKISALQDVLNMLEELS